MPLVFTQNEVNLSEHAYADVLGETYEYPSQYKNLIQPGEQFVYYRGRRRAGGGSTTPSYLGVGIVSAVSPIGDRFRCSITNFQPFDPPLPFKASDGYLEPEANSRTAVGFYFQTGVRGLDQNAFDTICALGLGTAQTTGGGAATPAAADDVSYADPAKAREVDELAMLLAINEAEERWPESRIVRMPHNNPGFDIEVRQPDGVIGYIEVKGTQAPKPRFFISAGELAFSLAHSDEYSIWIFHSMDLKARTATFTAYDGAVEDARFKLQPIQFLSHPHTPAPGTTVGPIQ
jgi:hypothetical protein